VYQVVPPPIFIDYFAFFFLYLELGGKQKTKSKK